MESIIKYPLQRFARRQNEVYECVLKDLRNGKKLGHWMWFIFPQLRGLGKSSNSLIYGIVNLREAREYLADPLLSRRLLECCEILLCHTDKTAREIFGRTDCKKLHSSMTLFSLVSEKNSVFHRMLEQFFGGDADENTLRLLNECNGYVFEDDVLITYCGEDEDVKIPRHISRINKYAFYKNKYIRSLTLERKTLIDDCAFSCCSELQKIEAPDGFDVKGFGRNIFTCCKKLADKNGFVIINGILFDCYKDDEHITVPDEVSIISNHSFVHCFTAKEITVPDSVEIIDKFAFSGCCNLEKISFSKEVKLIENGFSLGCRKLREISVSKENPYFYSEDNCLIESETKTLLRGYGNFSIPADGSVTKIAYAAFVGCQGIDEVYIPETITCIDKHIFPSDKPFSIVAKKGSFAEDYAKTNNIPFIEKN